MESHFDVAIIGGGPAGLAAAQVLGRQRRSVVLVDNHQPRNAAASSVHMLLGREGMSPEGLILAGPPRACEVPYRFNPVDRSYEGCCRGFEGRGCQRRQDAGSLRSPDPGYGSCRSASIDPGHRARHTGKASFIAHFVTASRLGTNLGCGRWHRASSLHGSLRARSHQPGGAALLQWRAKLLFDDAKQARQERNPDHRKRNRGHSGPIRRTDAANGRFLQR